MAVTVAIRNRHGASYLDRKKCRWKQRVAQRKSSRVYIHQSMRETEKIGSFAGRKVTLRDQFISSIFGITAWLIKSLNC